MKRRNSFLLHGPQQLAMGAVFSGIGFLLYTLATVMGREAAADALVMIFGVVSVYVFACVAAERRRDKRSDCYSFQDGSGQPVPLAVGPSYINIVGSSTDVTWE